MLASRMSGRASSGRALAGLFVVGLLCVPLRAAAQYEIPQEAVVRVIVVGQLAEELIEGFSLEIVVPDIGWGTGTVVSEDGLILTARHVVEGATGVAVWAPGSPEPVAAEIVYLDEQWDFAFLRVPLSFPVWVPMPAADQIPRANVGEDIWAFGYPVDVSESTAALFTGTVSRITNDGHYQVTTNLNEGISGGPLFTGAGLVGIAESYFTGTRDINFVVPIDPVVGAYYDQVLALGLDRAADERMMDPAWAGYQLYAAEAARLLVGFESGQESLLDWLSGLRAGGHVQDLIGAASTEPAAQIVLAGFLWDTVAVSMYERGCDSFDCVPDDEWPQLELAAELAYTAVLANPNLGFVLVETEAGVEQQPSIVIETLKQYYYCQYVNPNDTSQCASAVTTCVSDCDCPRPLICSGGACVGGSRFCTSNTDCCYTDVCLGGRCSAPTSFVCTTDYECAWPQICQGGQCVAPLTATPTYGCVYPSDCGYGYACINGSCQAAPLGATCTMDKECEYDQICREGYCDHPDDWYDWDNQHIILGGVTFAGPFGENTGEVSGVGAYSYERRLFGWAAARWFHLDILAWVDAGVAGWPAYPGDSSGLPFDAIGYYPNYAFLMSFAPGVRFALGTDVGVVLELGYPLTLAVGEGREYASETVAFIYAAWAMRVGMYVSGGTWVGLELRQLAADPSNDLARSLWMIQAAIGW
ncbi:MAG: trypsin-like peptidase domain-containing protein [Deltaproteobacteria bacterium]|nr:trypsin-like peptidase domain-containing protein [Deltaproteobacteria bacterium]